MTLTSLAAALSALSGALSEYGLSVSPARALIALKDGRKTMGNLAKDIGQSTAAATGTMESLVRKSLVERSTDSGDRRLIYVSLSPEGRSLVSSIEKKISSVN